MGGAERMLVQLAPALKARGLAQQVVTIGDLDHYAGELQNKGIPVTALGVHSFAGAPRALARLSSIMRSLRPRVVQGWMYHGNVLAALAYRLACSRRSSRLFWNLRASNMDDARYGGVISLSAWLSGWPDVVLANSEAGLSFHIGRGFRPRRSEVIPNGIDVEAFRPDPAVRARLRRELGINPDAVVALHVARVDAMKDHATFLAAMTRLPSVTGVMVGNGTDSLTVPPNVRGLGPRRDVAELCTFADLIVSTSAFGEGFSNAIAEGMSAGLIPVVTDVGDARLIVGSSGYVAPPRDVEAISAAIAHEASRTRVEREARGLAARARIAENFTLVRCVDAYFRLYASAEQALADGL